MWSYDKLLWPLVINLLPSLRPYSICWIRIQIRLSESIHSLCEPVSGFRESSFDVDSLAKLEVLSRKDGICDHHTHKQITITSLPTTSTNPDHSICQWIQIWIHHHTTTTVLRPFFRDHPGEPVSEENFWTLWCNGRLTEADTPTIRLGATPSGLTSATIPHIFTGQMPFLQLAVSDFILTYLFSCYPPFVALNTL